MQALRDRLDLSLRLHVALVSTCPVYFDWGQTTAYGNTIEYTGPIFAGTISVNISGLVCNTGYHFRARVVSDGGTSLGGDQAFTTSVCSGCGG